MVQEQVIAPTQLLALPCLLIGVNSPTTLFTPGTGMVPGRAIVAAAATIGRLLRAVTAAPTSCTYTVATSTPGRVATTSTSGAQSVA